MAPRPVAFTFVGHDAVPKKDYAIVKRSPWDVLKKKLYAQKLCVNAYGHFHFIPIKKFIENTVLIQTLSCLYSNESSECAESKNATFNPKRIWISQDMDDKWKIIDVRNSSNTHNSAQWNQKPMLLPLILKLSTRGIRIW